MGATEKTPGGRLENVSNSLKCYVAAAKRVSVAARWNNQSIAEYTDNFTAALDGVDDGS